MILIMRTCEETYEDFLSVKQRIRQEGFHYCFMHYSRFDHIEDEKFHELRENYLKCAKELEKYIDDTILNYPECDEEE